MICKILLLTSLVGVSNCWAEPVWHCSRSADASRTIEVAQADQFSIASLGSSEKVIGVSIRDLIDVFAGVPVKIGGETLSACFMSGNDSVTVTALTSLGLRASTIQSLARRSSIVQNHLFMVSDEINMQKCIAKHFPAVGYLSLPTETAHVMPCF
jgi:hypothetical protein